MAKARALDRKCAVVTGAGRNIGRAIAHALADAGASVYVLDIDREAAENVAGEISVLGGTASAAQCNVIDEASVDETFAAILRENPVNLLVNNAGGGKTFAPTWTADTSQWIEDVSLNIIGTFRCSRAVLPMMIERKSGRIVNLASRVATMPAIFSSAYCAGKAAVMRFTEDLALEAGSHGVKVFCIHPGGVRSDQAIDPQAKPESMSEEQMRALADMLTDPPELAADLVVKLASGVGDALTGRYVSAKDDFDELLERAGEIESEDAYRLRLRTLEPPVASTEGAKGIAPWKTR